MNTIGIATYAVARKNDVSLRKPTLGMPHKRLQTAQKRSRNEASKTWGGSS